MTSSFEELDSALENQGSNGLVNRLTEMLRERGDYTGLFYGLILGKRLELGLPAVQVGKSEELPPDKQEAYEGAIRDVARSVGELYLKEGNIPAAWPFFRMINEPKNVAQAIDQTETDDAELSQQLVEIALFEGVNPQRGFDLLLKRNGLCNAITTLGQELPLSNEAREYCVKQLVRTLYEELRERLAADLTGRGENVAPGASVREMLRGQSWLNDDDMYHVDVSHLSSIVQYCYTLTPGDEMKLAVELCEYGAKLSPRFQGQAEPPFDDLYNDYRRFFLTQLGEEVDENVAHFKAKAENMNAEDDGTVAAEVYVALLVRIKRYKEAVQAFGRYLAQTDARRLNCPSLQELCQLAGDFEPLIQVSLRRGDMVNYAAGLVQSLNSKSEARNPKQIRMNQ